MGTHFTAFTCQRNQTNKSETGAVRYGAVHETLSWFALTHLMLYVWVHVYALYMLQETQQLYPLQRQAYFLHTYTYTQGGCDVKVHSTGCMCEPDKMWGYEIRCGKNNRMKSQDACWCWPALWTGAAVLGPNLCSLPPWTHIPWPVKEGVSLFLCPLPRGAQENGHFLSVDTHSC